MTEQTNRRASLTRAGVRVLAGAAGIAASVVVVTAVTTLPLPSSQAHAVSRSVTPVPATATAACPGPLLQLGSDASTSAISALSTPQVVSGGAGAKPDAVDLSTTNVNPGGAAPRAYRQPATDGGKEPLVAAAQTVTEKTAEVSGTAAANCVQPDFDQWLVGGATSLGATTLVILDNPGDVSATVAVQPYSEQGLAEAAGGTGIVVKPHSQRVVPLAGLVPNASATVVHVTSTGGTVSAQLQESEVSGVTPQGVEWVGPTAAPAKKLVIPGALFDGTALSAATATDSGDGGVPVLRVLPVGTKDAKLSIGVKPASGKGAGTALTASVGHGVVSEVPLEKAGKGTYTITVDSSEPIVASVHTSTVVAKKGTDFTWYAAATPLKGAAAIPIGGGNATLHLTNTSSDAVTLTLEGKQSSTITVPANGSASHAFTKPDVLRVPDAKGVVASVTFASPGQLAAYVAYPTSASASALTVYKR
ncbi:hypothetical protein GCM10022286_28780 [Gryllotalpicola daejeonensis]|uniref:Choice-of-anchor D domain-containing protein n=1 Tax=Gryllotalpicola daejeonensis TaxID=993087 RepID=A0ABP7ZN66_9MICO